ncbi:hypothetical protein BO78DRAFT_329850 [Aspergillus sclerotiicarbonarius CBS 121057]|uniref:Uncharacterized protein n=1 Tax=Aspergillus sclerotiicarbonarius (strain CBS 121057 / IBT 28362) TaxID=1448318 RepID=A0A319DS77_ASPSB|nr:hypothetical protein BO78DRAFT_329850 [Aspergillus sclerotiicarbonarius CBS 121057]
MTNSEPTDLNDEERIYPYQRMALQNRSEYVATIRGVDRLLSSGSEGWATTHKHVGRMYRVIDQRLRSWIADFVLGSLTHLSNEQMGTILQSLEGYCVQEDWATLKRLLPSQARKYIGELLAESLIYKTIMNKVFENSFGYLDGKTGLADNGEDERFSMKLQYLYERFFQTNPESATLWKRQTHRLANSTSPSQSTDQAFGNYNAQRLKTVAKSVVTDLLASDPFRLLLIEPLDAAEVTKRQNRLIRVFESAVAAMHCCESYMGGHLDLRRLSELGESYRCGTDDMVFHFYNRHPDESTWEGHRILLVVKPAVIYSHNMPDIDSEYESLTTIVDKAMVLLAATEEEVKRSNDERDPPEDISTLSVAEIRQRKNSGSLKRKSKASDNGLPGVRLYKTEP